MDLDRDNEGMVLLLAEEDTLHETGAEEAPVGTGWAFVAGMDGTAALVAAVMGSSRIG